MDKCREYIDCLLDGSYQKMTAEEKSHLENQMGKNCLERFNKMKETLNIVNCHDVPDPGQAYWNNYWNNLENRMLEVNQGIQILKWPVLLKVAAILCAGIFIGYLIFHPISENKHIAATTSPAAKMVALNKKTANLLEDSKILLLGIVNLDTPPNDSEKVDFSFQKDFSNRLLKQTADLKQQLSKTKNRRVVSLLNELELIFMQIANIENDFDLPAIEIIKKGADNQSLLFKINMERLLLEAKSEHDRDKTRNKKNEL